MAMDAMPMQDDEGEEQAVIQHLIAELEQLAQGGRGMEIAQRLGKGAAPMGDAPPEMPGQLEGSPDEEAGETLAQEDAEPVPGAEPDDGEGGDDAGAGGADPEKMRALLASLKSRG